MIGDITPRCDATWSQADVIPLDITIHYTMYSRTHILLRPYHTSTTMPLVVPGITSSLTGDQKTDWIDKLLGKKLTDSTNNEVVRVRPIDFYIHSRLIEMCHI